MERISAACAMEWSIELEKGLRSKKPVRPVEAILEIGPRLEQWSKEPIPTKAVLSMFGLVPGEDRLFANTILLRLADAFRYGDKHMRFCVLKVFLSEMRHCNRKGILYKGILAKQRVPNYLELLRRIKIVFDTGDVESRSLALRLLGCWASIAKDSAEIRYMILSSLGSCHDLEVKASLFAAGCFSELSEDFASIVLEILINMMTSSKTTSTVKLAGARVFAKMGSSYRLASRSYKTGRKLVLDNSSEEVIVEMLTSLSKLASKSMLLISAQVDLLISFITQKSALSVQATTLRCLYFLLVGGVFHLSINASVITTLIHILDNSNLPTVSQCEALRILCKIFQSTLPDLPYMEVPEFVKLVSIVESATQSPITSKRFLALHLLVDISCNHCMAMEMVPGGNGTSFLSRVILLVLDQIALLVKSVVKLCGPATELKQEFQSLLKLVFGMVEEYPTLGVLALDKIKSLVESLVDLCEGGISERKSGSSSVHEIVVLEGKKHCPIASNLVFCVVSFLESCIDTLDEAGAVTTQVHHIVKLLAEIIHKSSFYNHSVCAIYLHLLHSRVIWSCLGNENKEICNTEKDLGISHTDNYCFEHERLTLEFVKKMLDTSDNWAAYRAGKCAACQGAWLAAVFTFRQLENRVQSDAYQYWLKSLALFSQAESIVLLLPFPKHGLGFVDRLQINEIWVTNDAGALGGSVQGVSWNADLWGYYKGVNEAYTVVCSAVEMLEAAVTSDQTFIFQRWFLVLRAKVLEIVVDILRFLCINPSNEESIGSNGQAEGSANVGLPKPVQHVCSLAYFLTGITFRLKRLVQEFDLLATSFMGMDSKSFRTISRLALNCSLLAFLTGFALYFPNLHSYEKSISWDLEDSKKFSYSMLIQDLVERLWRIDSETSTDLKRVLSLIGEPNGCFHAPPRALLYRAGHRERETLDVCRFSVTGVLCMQEAKGMNNESTLYRESGARLQLLSNVLKKWISLPFQAPNFFFRVRPCVGAELFAFNADARDRNVLSVFQGFHLSLNLCVQLKNAPPVLPFQIKKLYCILATKPSHWTPEVSGESKGQMQLGSQFWDIDNAVDFNEKLVSYVIEGIKKTSRKRGRACGSDGSVWSCVGFEPYEKGHGFSTCLLDVSAFPVGSYQIKWHGGCIDNQGSYWSLIPLNMGPVFNVKKAPVTS